MNLYTEFVGLDIGTAAMKFVSVSGGKPGGGYRLDDLFQCPLPEGFLQGGFTNPSITNVKEFQKLVAKNAARLSSTKGGFLVGLPDRWVKLHLLELVLKESEMNSAEYLKWRLQKILPLPEGIPVTIDQQILSVSPTDEGFACKVLAGAMRSDMLDMLSAVFAEARMEIMGFDTSSLGIFNLLEEIHPESTLDLPVIIVHAGHDTTAVRIFHQGQLAYERIIEVAGEEISKLFAESYQIPLEQAQAQKVKRKFFPETREELVQALEERHHLEKVFGNWLRELNVTFRFYLNKFQVRSLPHVYLTGGTAMFKGLTSFLSDYFSTQVSIFNPLEDMPFQQEPNREVVTLGPLFAPALALLSH